MELLFPRTESSAVDVHAHYAAGWSDDGGVRVNFITSADGAATANGLSRELQTAGDNTVFAALRDLADVILVGASTAAAEGYKPSAPGERRRAIRESYGLPPAPAIAVVSGSLDMDLDAALYREAVAAPTIVITASSAPVARRNDIIDLAGTETRLQLLEVAAAETGGIDFALAIESLRDQGYRRILCEGGPRLFAAGVAAGAVDELCLSYSPVLAGPAGPRIVGGDPWSTAARLELVGLLLEDSALFARYRLESATETN